MKKKHFRNTALFLLILLVVLFFVWQSLPYKGPAANEIKSIIEQSGVKVNTLTVDSMNNNSLALSEISLNDKPTISIAKVNLAYDLREFLTSHFYSNMNVKLNASGLKIDAQPYLINSANANINAVGDSGKWGGKFAVNDIAITGLPQDIPTLKLEGDFTSADSTDTNFHMFDATGLYDITASVYLAANNTGSAIIKKLQFPWGGGRIYMNETQVPMPLIKPLPLVINLENVDLSTLLGKISGDKITGNGRLTGTLPLTYYPDGKITLQQGGAQAISSGVISVSPSLIPGDNEQLALARDALQNFNYTSLNISVSSDKDDRSVISLSLEGTNPEKLGTRPVNLNINLAGDIIPLIQESILPLQDFRQLMNLRKLSKDKK